MCEKLYENDWHVFFGCDVLQAIWEATNLWHIIKENLETADGFVSLFVQHLEQLPQQQLLTFIMTLWCIWKRSNDKLWNDAEISPRMSVHMARETLLEWQQARTKKDRSEEEERNNNESIHHDQNRWRKPEEGVVKCNIDASIFKEKGCYGIGICLRGRHGEYIKARTYWFQGLPQPHEAEARGLKEALKWLGNLSFSKVSIELDCKQVVDGMTKKLNTNSMFGAILEICKASLNIYQNFKISFIRRQANNVAHLLARASLSYASSQVHDHMSSCIETVIMNEMS